MLHRCLMFALRGCVRLGRWSHRVRLDEAAISSRGGATILGLSDAGELSRPHMGGLVWGVFPPAATSRHLRSRRPDRRGRPASSCLLFRLFMVRRCFQYYSDNRPKPQLSLKPTVRPKYSLSKSIINFTSHFRPILHHQNQQTHAQLFHRAPRGASGASGAALRARPPADASGVRLRRGPPGPASGRRLRRSPPARPSSGQVCA